MEEDTAEEAARHNVCNVCPWVHHIPSINPNQGLLRRMYWEEPPHPAKASSRIAVHLFCSVRHQSRGSHCSLIAHKTFHCPMQRLLSAFHVHQKKKDGNYLGWCVRTGHTRTITDYNYTLYALALKAQAVSSLERWIYWKYANCCAAQDNLFPITERDKLFKNKISDGECYRICTFFALTRKKLLLVKICLAHC